MSSNTGNTSRTIVAQIQNGTDRDEYIPTILTYVSIPVVILGLIGNGAVFQILCCRVKRTNYTVYVLNLAIADFIVLFCNISFSAFSLIIWKTFDFERFLFVVLDILWFFGYNYSFFLLTAISVERCLGVFYPFWYHSNRPEHLSAILCTVLWVISCLVTVVEYFTCWSEFERYQNQCYTKYIAASIFLVTIFLIFTPVMVLCSLIMFVKVQRRSQPSSARLYLTIAVTIVIFLIFALPGRFAYLVGYWHPEVKLIWNVVQVSFFLNIVNSTLNPFVYFFVGRQKKPRFHEPLSVVFQRSWNDHMNTTEEA
ncbi:proto-oncogene Mas-like [Sphaerodactylus townsendi]|uniref:proto-oncogene Mas-like n=1 Tax=Sphaerodactylus townsendi TaxID=933632 RepID=UPI0020271763|nr:proto-oncogene Mas-like [Sphaerodactylus townsendi]XP_048343748.1 proto-oncogene Mas-like [Sphaerodactylus townsendi]XP_048343759.1 proto-oncogene Mas-like [Sphaerodactylus townsendi]